MATNCFQHINDLQAKIDSLSEQGYSYETTNYGWNGKHAVTFWKNGEAKGEPQAVHKNLRHAVLKAVEKVKQQKTTQ